jgi:mRNA-degrading endonuclease RelE of RelBE toxin-antitoxin system
MDKIFKFLNKRSSEERCKLILAIRLISENNLDQFDVKKLKGHSNIFRARVSNFRIIFEKIRNENHINTIAKRDDRTYDKY